MGLQLPPCFLIWPVPGKNPALWCRCVWRFTADNLQDVQNNPAWQCPCCRPPPALALQYPPRSRHRTSLQLGSWERGLREDTPFNSGSGDGIKRRPSHSGPSSPRRGVSASAEVQQSLQFKASTGGCCHAFHDATCSVRLYSVFCDGAGQETLSTL